MHNAHPTIISHQHRTVLFPYLFVHFLQEDKTVDVFSKMENIYLYTQAIVFSWNKKYSHKLQK